VAGNNFDVFRQPRVNGCLKVLGIEPGASPAFFIFFAFVEL